MKLIFLWAIFFIGTGNAQALSPGDIHKKVEDKYCSICHDNVSQVPKIPSKGNLKMDINTLCSRKCHNTYKSSHPLNVKSPHMKKNALPLNSHKEIDCNTCHDAHNINRDEMLLRKKSMDLCNSCHVK